MDSYSEWTSFVCAFHRKDTYYLPGGKREAGETDEETLVREIEEEISVRIKPETISYFGTFEAEAHGKEEGVIVKMTCYIADFEGSLSPASEIDELSWLSYKDRNRVSVVTQIILINCMSINYFPNLQFKVLKARFKPKRWLEAVFFLKIYERLIGATTSFILV